MTMTVAADASILGSFTDVGSGSTGVLKGRTDKAGNIHASVAFSGSSKASISAKITTNSGAIQGNGVETFNGNQTPISFQLPASTSIQVSTFAGGFWGPWHSGTSGSGTFTIAVGLDGNFAASIQNAQTSQTAYASGHVDANGHYQATATFKNPSLTWNLSGVMDGGSSQAGISSSGTISVGGATSDTFDFVTSRTDGNSQFVGSYIGTWNVLGTGHSGTMTMTVGDDNGMNGTLFDNSTGTAAIIMGTCDNFNNFVATATFPASGSKMVITGRLALTNIQPPGLSGDGFESINGGTPNPFDMQLLPAPPLF